MIRNRKLCLGIVVLLAGLMSLPRASVAESEKPTCDMLLGVFSQYIWRGFELSQDSIVLFPQTTVSYKGFSFDIWAALDTDYAGDPIDNGTELVETDLTLSYGNSVGMLNYTVGWIYYDLDAAEDQEMFVTLGLDTVLSPALTVYRGIEHTDAWYYKFALSHSFELANGWSLDVGGWIGYYDIPDGASDGGDYSEFHDANLSVGLSVPITNWCTVTPSISYSFALSDEAEDLIEDASFDGNDAEFLYGGVTLAVSF